VFGTRKYVVFFCALCCVVFYTLCSRDRLVEAMITGRKP